MYFSAAASSENDHGSMNLASNTAPLASTRPSRVAAIHRTAGCRIRRWTSVIDLPGIELVPAPVKILGDRPKLDNEVPREVLRLDLPAFLPPQPHQGDLIIAHDDPGVRTADESCAYLLNRYFFVAHFHCSLSSRACVQNLLIDPMHESLPRAEISI